MNILSKLFRLRKYSRYLLNIFKIQRNIKINKKSSKYRIILVYILLLLLYLYSITYIKKYILIFNITNILLILSTLYLHFKYRTLLDNIYKDINNKFSDYDMYNQFLKIKYENEKYKIKNLIIDDYTYSLEDKINVVIGKLNSICNIDIDLSNHEYSALVSKVHAIMNKQDNIWYIEDLNSKNGVYIEKNSSAKKKIEKNKKYKLEVGDIVYISIIKIVLK